MAKLSDQQLLDMFPAANDWTPEAITAAAAELQNRHIQVPPVAAPPPNIDYKITADGRTYYFRAAGCDIPLSLFVPGWGILCGLLVLIAKGEWWRALTMIFLGMIPIFILFVFYLLFALRNVHW